MFNCPYCEKKYPSIVSLSLHCRKGHAVTAKQFYTKFYLNDVTPTCKCGCGQETTFLDVTRGFREYIRGHVARVKNNFNTEKSMKNSQKTRRKMVQEGTWKPFHTKETGEHWSKGLTKETDERIARKVENLTEEDRRVLSERMRKGRLDGTIPTLSGKDHSQWKGGASALLSVCHGNRRLFQEWKYPLLVKAKFQCEKCGASRNDSPRAKLEVHHDKEMMSEIVRKVAQKHSWEDNYTLPTSEQTFELKTKIAEEVADFHIENNVSGVVLCVKCHKEEHDKHNLS